MPTQLTDPNAARLSGSHGNGTAAARTIRRRRSLPGSRAVVGGLLFSQLVTLYLTPVFYTYMAQLQTWLKPAARPVIAEAKG